MSPFEIMDLIREAVDAEREKHVRILRILERLIDEERAKNRDLCAVIREERERDEEDPLRAAINRACEELPDGFDIVLRLERGAGTVCLEDREGMVQHIDVDADERLVEEINFAVNIALAYEGGPERAI